MKKEYRFVVTENDSTFACIENIRKENPNLSYRECFNQLCSDYMELKKIHSSQSEIADMAVEKLKEEYDAIWRVRSYATGKNVEILLELMNSILLKYDIEGVTTDKKKATGLSIAETAVKDRLRKYRTHALSQKGKRK